MDIVEKIAGKLDSPLITAAGLCTTPPEIDEGDAGDIDIFVYCTKMPSAPERWGLLEKLTPDYTLGVEKTRWGVCDLAMVGGEEVWLMYVTEEEAIIEVRSILAGDLPDKLDNYYYPVGRLATIKNLKVLYDRDGFLGNLKSLVSVYPEALAKRLIAYHSDALTDIEDLERSAKRGDTLFYHSSLDIALDHFLQALFALNREYFPSRKRSLKYIEGFGVKPPGCGEILENIIKAGAVPESLGVSFDMMKKLIDWTREQAEEAAQP